MKNMYQLYIRSILDYGMVIWYPSTFGQIDQLEQIVRIYTKKIPVVSNMHYWDRLVELDISSVQRRCERYSIITLWKIMEGLLPGSQYVNHTESRKGRVIILPRPPLNISNTVVKLRQETFFYRAGSLYNACPRYVRDTKGVTLDVFKSRLNRFLRWVPDHPRDPGSGYYPEAYDSVRQSPSNSIIHWRILMERQYPDYQW